MPRLARNDDTKKPQTTPQQTTTVPEYPSRILKVICGIQQILCPLDFAALSVNQVTVAENTGTLLLRQLPMNVSFGISRGGKIAPRHSLNVIAHPRAWLISIIMSSTSQV